MLTDMGIETAWTWTSSSRPARWRRSWSGTSSRARRLQAALGRRSPERRGPRPRRNAMANLFDGRSRAGSRPDHRRRGADERAFARAGGRARAARPPGRGWRARCGRWSSPAPESARFCAGANLKERQGWTRGRRAALVARAAHRLSGRSSAAPSPGSPRSMDCARRRCELALACDLRVMDPGGGDRADGDEDRRDPGRGRNRPSFAHRGHRAGKGPDPDRPARASHGSAAARSGQPHLPGRRRGGGCGRGRHRDRRNARSRWPPPRRRSTRHHDLPMDGALEMERLHYEKALLSGIVWRA